jgi:thioredoxin reductase
MSGTVDLAIIGAGPAGMSAAYHARTHGLSVVLLDEQLTPGGQVYRGIATARDPRLDAILGKDYAFGEEIYRRFAACGADYRPGSTVWRIGAEGLSMISTGRSDDLLARRTLVATGAMERPFPAKGWTLPGVMTAGAAQILLKTSRLVAEDAVFIGCGPLLYLGAYQYLKAGVAIRAILDTAPRENLLPAAAFLPGALRQPGYIAKGLRMIAALRLSGIRIHRNIRSVSFSGKDRLDTVHWRDKAGEHSLECTEAFVHQGVIPNVNMTMSTGCRHVWDEGQLCWRPELDAFGRTSHEWLMAAGDGGGIGGARSAALSGAIAALAAARDLGRLDAGAFESESAPLLAARRRDLAVRPFLDRLYRPLPGFRVPEDEEAIICRCEEVTCGDVARAVGEGCPGPNQLKSFTRAGMGPCQGRLCGHTVTETIARLSGRAPQEVGYYRIRTPIKPVTVGDIAGRTENAEQGAEYEQAAAR